MANRPVDHTPRGRLRALYQWLTGGPLSPNSPPRLASDPAHAHLPARIGHDAISSRLGAGAMGVVYAARDERLERTVAVKTMSPLAADETARKRFWREARAAASVNHPNVCQICSPPAPSCSRSSQDDRRSRVARSAKYSMPRCTSNRPR